MPIQQSTGLDHTYASRRFTLPIPDTSIQCHHETMHNFILPYHYGVTLDITKPLRYKTQLYRYKISLCFAEQYYAYTGQYRAIPKHHIAALYHTLPLLPH